MIFDISIKKAPGTGRWVWKYYQATFYFTYRRMSIVESGELEADAAGSTEC